MFCAKNRSAIPVLANAQVLGKQLLRSGTSVAANYRAACRGRYRAEFSSKIGVVVEEADETLFWLEMLGESGIVAESKIAELKTEARQLTALFTATHHTMRSKR